MVAFWIYDVSFLILFTAFITWFLNRRRSDLSREGIVFMYRTQFGVDAINWFVEKFSRTLHKIKYVIVAVGFFLMATMIWMLGQTVSIYILHPEITKLVKAPPVAPLIPYFPKLFGMESFFPPFYFTYFLIALAVIAISHEFSHGIFMRLFKVKIKSTGMVFLGPILGAFVEQDNKSFKSKKNFEQMVVLAAGVFANIIMALIFYGLYVGFFFSSFTASGYIFSNYATTQIPFSSIENLSNTNEELILVNTSKGNFYMDKNLAIQLAYNNSHNLLVFSETPALLSGIKGAIIQANDIKISNQADLIEFLQSKNPGDTVTLTTENNNEIKEYQVTLGKNPSNSSLAYLGVSNNINQPRGFIQKFLNVFMNFKDPSTLYEPTWSPNFVEFIYHLLWWVMIINLLVALFNMMPIGMLDGGMFFYLTILSIFKSKRIAKIAYKASTYLIILSFVLLMFFWFIRII